MHFKRLIIVSDTALYSKSKQNYGFGPVVRELEEIDSYFDEIVWIGFKRIDKIDDLSMQVISSKKVSTIFLNSVGGKNFISSLKVLCQYPKMFLTIWSSIQNADIVHTRGPSHPAIIAILISFFSNNKIWWHKYAGDWSQLRPPPSYGFQRWMLKKADRSKVTINGFWLDQPAHCYSFENPCLTADDINRGIESAKNQNFNTTFTFSFIGRLEDPKGVTRILNALKSLPLSAIEQIHFIGDGEKTAHYHKLAAFLGEKVKFHGFLGKDRIHKILAGSHFLLLPSTASEGFPKVIAEAACYGVIPIVSDVGSIPHYIDQTNGFIWKIKGDQSFEEVLSDAIATNPKLLREKSENVLNVAKKFTFENYSAKLEKYIFSKDKM